jgi:hypothetical protein
MQREKSCRTYRHRGDLVLRQDGDRHEATTATKAQHTVLFLNNYPIQPRAKIQPYIIGIMFGNLRGYTSWLRE